MADVPASHEHQLKQLISTYRCKICRRSFDRDQVRVAARHEQLWIFSVRCRRCRRLQVFWFALNDRARDAAHLGDLTEEEKRRFSAGSAINGDDVLDIHEFLAQFDGDFKRLFGV